MGSSSSSNSNSLNWGFGTSSTDPWSVQTPYLKSAFQRAEDAYNKTMSQGPYTGDYIDAGDAKNTAAYNQAYNFGTDPTNNGYVQNQMNQANGWINSGTDYMNQGAQGLKDLSGDQTQNIINSAGQYADNPYISAAVKSAMFDANRQASENTLPNLYRSAAGANALNSDRAALGQGVVERGLADQAGNISANMRYNAYNSGLNTAQSELNARRQGYGALAGLGQSQANMGMQGLTSGINDQSRLNQMSAAGASGLQQMRQAGLDNALAKYQNSQNFPWAALANYYNIIGNRSWGGTTNWAQVGGNQTQQTTQQNPGAASIIGGALGGIGGLFSGGSGSAMSGLFNFL